MAAARDLIEKSLEAGDVETAWFAIDKGLLVSRDFELFEAMLRVAAATGNLETLDKAWQRVVRMFGALPDLLAVHEALRRELTHGEGLSEC